MVLSSRYKKLREVRLMGIWDDLKSSWYEVQEDGRLRGFKLEYLGGHPNIKNKTVRVSGSKKPMHINIDNLTDLKLI